jgi:voltage-gated potassium channel
MRTIWDAGALVLILFGCFFVPYQLVFVSTVGWSSSLAIYLIDAFFLVDLWVNYRTSYWSQGREVVDAGRIGSRYLRGRFGPDLAAALPIDALFLASDVEWGGVPVVLVLRLTRLVRVVRLIGIVGSWGRFVRIHTGLLRIGRLLLVIAIAVHWVACGWFWLGVSGDSVSSSWVAAAGIADAPAASQYLRSIYWAIVTTTTVGYGDITPQRDVEYIYSLVVLGLGASMYAVMIANIASILANLDRRKIEFWSREEAMERFLHSREVSRETVQRVRGYHAYMWDRYRGMNEYALFDDLPTSMRVDVLREISTDLVAHVPMFRHSPPALRDALLTALRPLSFVPGTVAVREGDIADGIYFVSGGRLSVQRQAGTTPDIELGPGEYFGDLSLMLDERRTASLVTRDYCDLLFLPKADFERFMRRFPEFKEVLSALSAQKSEKMSALVLDGIVL